MHDRARHERVSLLTAELKRREARRRQAAEGGLMEFVRYFWHVLEPATPLVEGWVMEAICLHLEAVTFGDIKRLLINVGPGSSKSLLTSVFWPAWEWGPMGLSHIRTVNFAYGSHLTERDNGRFRRLVKSQAFQELWGDSFALTKDGEVKVENDSTGWKFASSVEGVGTGERGDRVVLDDPHNATEAESDPIRERTVRFFRESMSSRLNDLKESAIVVIMQRLHDQDVSGIILEHYPEYVHMCVPAEYDPYRHCTTKFWTDPRSVEGELAWPERFPPEVLAEFKKQPFVWAGQYQQSPEVRGGGIIKRSSWQLYTVEEQAKFGVKPSHNGGLQFPPFEYIVASLDSSYTEKEENDPNGFCIFGIFHDERGRPNIMLITAWRKWLELHGEIIEKRSDESLPAYVERAKPSWGLVEWVAHECKRWHVDRLLIEGKASGLSVGQELKRIYANETWGVEITNPKGEGSTGRGGNDKVARLWSVSHLFQDGLIWVPGDNVGTADRPNWQPKAFGELLIDECAKYPRGYKDIADAMVYALKHLRRAEYALRKEEFDIIELERKMHKRKAGPIYGV